MDEITKTKTFCQVEKLKKYFVKNLAKRPYCSNNFTFGLRILPAQLAINHQYIQFNTQTDINWLVYDIDYCIDYGDWLERGIPMPHIVVMNPENGHAHVYYKLKTPVHIQSCAHRNPIRYISAIDVAMTYKLGADMHYTKLMAKNPLHSAWITNYWPGKAYTLDDLAKHLNLSAFRDARRRLPEIGLGRNCNLFDKTRFWAYKKAREWFDWQQKDYMGRMHDSIITRCIDYAISRNNFERPLGYNECRSIGKSVGKWICRHMSKEGFDMWAENRRKKSIRVRKNKKDQRRKKALALYKKGYTQKEIAAQLNITERTVRRMGIFSCKNKLATTQHDICNIR